MHLGWLLVIVSGVAGFAIALGLVKSIPAALYPYLLVLFLVALDALFYSGHRLDHSERIFLRLFQRTVLQLAYGGFIIFFGAQAGYDLLLLAVIPLAFNVFAHFVQLIPREAGEILWLPRTPVQPPVAPPPTVVRGENSESVKRTGSVAVAEEDAAPATASSRRA